MGGKKLLLWKKDLWPRISWKQEFLQRFSSYLQVEMCHIAQRTLYIGCFSSYVKKWDSVPSFEISVPTTHMSSILKQQQIHFGGCGLDIKMIEQAKQRENFNTEQSWLHLFLYLNMGGSLLINPKTLKYISPQCHKGLLLVRITLAEKGVVMPSLKDYTLVESKKRKKKIPLNTIL